MLSVHNEHNLYAVVVVKDGVVVGLLRKEVYVKDLLIHVVSIHRGGRTTRAK